MYCPYPVKQQEAAPPEGSGLLLCSSGLCLKQRTTVRLAG